MTMMTKQQIFEAITAHPAFYLATVDGDQPRVRAMFMYRADERGIIFHTATAKEVRQQISKNGKVELCFSCDAVQIRISGELEEICDNAFKDEICEHPSRKFLKNWRETGAFKDFYKDITVYALKNGTATLWTMAQNFAPKDVVQL